MNTIQRKLFELLYVEYYENLNRYAYSILHDWQLAEDAVQKTFEVACRKADDINKVERPLGWLMEIMKNVLRNMMRERLRRERIICRMPEDGEKLLYAAPMEESLQHIRPRDMNRRDFEIFVQVAVNGYTSREVARMYDMGVWACRKRIERTKKRLKNFFEEMEK